eukprot:TRINITY_DN7975_c0_g1_i1.p1 TRINITY_DN7975_c0_g1~~TRINITY_DN7975_c0_g1_i1.p1  ORF type:complete len:422 (+),score=136.42 TRINITY_DN7975_c0_g1_i1:28-1266(+)
MSKDLLKPKTQEAELLKQLNAQAGNAKQQDIKPIFALKGEKRDIGDKDVIASQTLFIKGCTDCEFVISGTSVKILVEGCNNTTITFNGVVKTEVVEIWNCNNCQFTFHTPVKTLQMDMCKKIDIVYRQLSDFNRLVWAALFDYTLSFENNEIIKENIKEISASELALLRKKERRDKNIKKVGEEEEKEEEVEETKPDVTKLIVEKLSSGFKQKQEEYQGKLSEATDQFIVRILNENILAEELIVRLANGFPTTEREAIAFDEEQQKNREAMEAYVRQLVDHGSNKLGLNRLQKQKIPRNAPCPCESGRKYKVCCGSAKKLEEEREAKRKIMEKEFAEKKKLEDKAKWKKPTDDNDKTDDADETTDNAASTPAADTAPAEGETEKDQSNTTTTTTKKKKRGGRKGRGGRNRRR